MLHLQLMSIYKKVAQLILYRNHNEIKSRIQNIDAITIQTNIGIILI